MRWWRERLRSGTAPGLTGRAYRIVGSFADADDVVQEAWLRWHAADQADIDNPDAWLNTVVSRLAIDRLRQRKRDEERTRGRGSRHRSSNGPPTRPTSPNCPT
ncbi:MAG: sigma factor [Ilumatobacteraceae bacterium]